jgi:hypothetical protein
MAKSQRSGEDLGRSVQRAVDLVSQFAGDAVHLGNVVGPRLRHAAHAAKALQQAGTALGADAGNVFKLAAARAHLGPGRMPVMAKR